MSKSFGGGEMLDEYLKAIKNAYFEISEDTPIGLRAKNYLIIALNRLRSKEPKLKEAVNNTLLGLARLTRMHSSDMPAMWWHISTC